MAAELAAQLAPGRACPVCGSAEHPAPAQAAAGAVTGQDLTAAEEQRDRAEARRRQLEDKQHQLDAEVAACAAVAGGRTAADLAAEVAALAGRVAAAGQAAADVSRRDREAAAGRAEQQQLAAQLLDATARKPPPASRRPRPAEPTWPAWTRSWPRPRRSIRRSRRGRPRCAAPPPTTGSWAWGPGHAPRPPTPPRPGPGSGPRPRRADGFATLEQASAAVLSPPQQAALEEQVTSWDARMAALRGLAAQGSGTWPGSTRPGPGRCTKRPPRPPRPSPRRKWPSRRCAPRTRPRPERCGGWASGWTTSRRPRTRRPAGGGHRSGDPAGWAGQGHGRAAPDGAHHLCAPAVVRPGGGRGQRPAVRDVSRPV